MSLLGFVTYYIYPVAPPWYVEQYGLGPAVLDAPGSAARLAAVDALLGVDFFTSAYSRNANIFAALPSMHSVYPLVAWIYARKAFRRAHWLVCGLWLLVCFSAIYLNHHYVIDLLAALVLTLVAYGVVELVARRRLHSHPTGRSRAASPTSGNAAGVPPRATAGAAS